MKVISAPDADWIGKRLRCPNCGVVVELEASDCNQVAKDGRTDMHGRFFLKLACQFCRGVVSYEEIPNEQS